MHNYISFSIQVTLHLERQLYAVVFGCNMFVSLLIESVITFLVADRAGIGLGLKDQVRNIRNPNILVTIALIFSLQSYLSFGYILLLQFLFLYWIHAAKNRNMCAKCYSMDAIENTNLSWDDK
jgi:hypothetical protein